MARGMKTSDARRAIADLSKPDAPSFWNDVLLTALLGWVALFVASTEARPAVCAVALVLAVLAMFRATVFMHELAHLGRGQVRGIRPAWNLLVGVPMMLPSWLYERMHLDHHRASHYGTARDPEYVALSFMAPWKIVATSLAGVFLPFALLLRFAAVAPLSWLFRPLRRVVVARMSTLTVNPHYAAGPLSRGEIVYEVLATAASWGWIALFATGALPLRVLACLCAAVLATMALHQVRALITHRYQSPGTRLAMEEVLIDSINFVPRSRVLAMLLPAGARMHALHHLAPSVPFHNLETAHARLLSSLPQGSAYHRASETRLSEVLSGLFSRAHAHQNPRQVVLVTGASSGFGLKASIELARQGHRVFAGLRNPLKGAAVYRAAAEAGVTLETVHLDVDDEGSIAECVREVIGRAGRLDVLVNNAGIAVAGFFEDQSTAEVREQLQTNLLGAMQMTRAVLPHLRARGSGRIVNVSSIGGRVGSPGLSVYCASKFALNGFSEALRHELAGFGIEVTLVEPGTYPTDIFFDNRRTAVKALRDDSVYRARFEAGQAVMYGDLEKNQADPREVGLAIARAATVRRPRLRYPVGKDARFAAWAMKLLPERVFQALAGARFQKGLC
jgi:NAD(P)-dependent dehydrogenase (short-subunit alcohol dehydrogenase family)/fatty acid desaturase